MKKPKPKRLSREERIRREWLDASEGAAMFGMGFWVIHAGFGYAVKAHAPYPLTPCG